jgi:hypothetical protein
MTGTAPFIKPSGSIIIAPASGSPLCYFYKVRTATNVEPGRQAKYSTSDREVIVATANSASIGVVGYENADSNSQPTNIDTDYTVNTYAPIHFGGGFLFNAKLSDAGGSHSTITPGDRLYVGANGLLLEGSASTVTIASGSTYVLSDKQQPDETVSGHVLSGPIVAMAYESVTTSADADDCGCLSLI